MNPLILDAISRRRSIRKFKPCQIPKEHLESMLEAAMMAPSAINLRPWEFVVVEDMETRIAITKIQPYTKFLPNASLAVIVCARPAAKSASGNDFWPQDCAAATENFLLQAQHLGYGTCWCALYPLEARMDAMKELLQVDSMPFSIIALGLPDESPAPCGFYDPERVKFI